MHCNSQLLNKAECDLENFVEVEEVDDTLLDRCNSSDHMKAVSNDLLFYYKIYSKWFLEDFWLTCIAKNTFACKLPA